MKNKKMQEEQPNAQASHSALPVLPIPPNMMNTGNSKMLESLQGLQ